MSSDAKNPKSLAKKLSNSALFFLTALPIIQKGRFQSLFEYFLTINITFRGVHAMKASIGENAPWQYRFTQNQWPGANLICFTTHQFIQLKFSVLAGST